MISSIEGILENYDSNSVNIRVGPICLTIYVSKFTLNQLGKIGETVYLYTHLYLKEDNISLYGFASEGEVKLFQKLISVSGVGPRLALSLLSVFEPQQLLSAIINSDIDLISEAPGLGKKIAGRIILELKGKLEKESSSVLLPSISKENADVISALTGLGYSLREAAQAVASLSGSSDLTLEEKLKYALQHLASK